MSDIHAAPDMTLAATAAPLVRAAGGTLRSAVDALRGCGFGAVQLDLALPGIRPRELSVRGRRDLLAMLARAGVALAGVELFLPRKHYLDAAVLDRAVAATLAAIELAADLGRVALSLALPVRELAADVADAIVTAAEGRSVSLAVHAEDQLDDLGAWLERVDEPMVGAGLDPAGLLALGVKPEDAVHRLARRLVVARLSDASAGGLRCAIGRGDLDVLAYRVAVDLARTRLRPVVLDLRGLDDALSAATRAQALWRGLGPAA